MEPLLPEETQGLENLATDLVAKASGLAGRVNPILAEGVGDLVRSMNCYYSNLIEGHQTCPSISTGRSTTISRKSRNAATSKRKPAPTSRSSA